MVDGEKKEGPCCAYCRTRLRYLEVCDHISGEEVRVVGCPHCWKDAEAVGELVFGRFRVSQ